MGGARRPGQTGCRPIGCTGFRCPAAPARQPAADPGHAHRLRRSGGLVPVGDHRAPRLRRLPPLHGRGKWLHFTRQRRPKPLGPPERPCDRRPAVGPHSRCNSLRRLLGGLFGSGAPCREQNAMRAIVRWAAMVVLIVAAMAVLHADAERGCEFRGGIKTGKTSQLPPRATTKNSKTAGTKASVTAAYCANG